MTDKEAVLEALRQLPEDASLEEISEELQIMEALHRARVEDRAGPTKSHFESVRLLESWAAAWSSR